MMREKLHKKPIKQPRSNKTIHIPYRKQMLTARAYRRRVTARNDDVVHESWQWRCTADEEGSDRTPVRGEFGRVAVDAVEPVHIRYTDVAAADDEVVAH